MRFAEIFASLQGEGRWTGVPSIFLRTQGCPLSCWFCDTPYAVNEANGDGAKPNKILSLEQVVQQVGVLAGDLPNQGKVSKHVVVTGGEPFLHAELVPLTQKLHESGYTITIETAGLFDLPVYCDLISISPKLSNSVPQTTDLMVLDRHENVRNRPEIVRKLIKRYPYQLKFVVNEPNDLIEILSYLSQFAEIAKSQVYLMPQGVAPEILLQKETWLRPLCEEHGFQFCPRMHIHWFGNKRGT